MTLPDFQQIRRILSPDPRSGALPVVAVVGLSPKPDRPSNMVARYLLAQGFPVLPVNPGQHEILGRPCYPDLDAIGRPVDIVVIFRRSDQVLPVVEAAINCGAGTVWMQEGVRNREAALLAEAAGLTVIMDRCIKTDHEQLRHRP